MNLAKLNVVIGAEIDDFERELKTLEKGIGRLGDKLQDAGGTLTKFVTLPLSLLAGASLKAAGDMQALEKGFKAVYKGAGDVGKELLKVQEIAELPGLGLKEALQGSINLQAAGFSADQAKKALTGFGNALATVGKGKADLEGVTTALSQMAAKGKLSAEEINQIAERVPQIRQVMKAAFGTSNTEDLTKLGVSVEEFVSKVTDELNKLPKVSGGINNAFENMADKGLLALSTLGNSINTTFNVEGILNSFASSLQGVVKGFTDLDPATQKVILVIGGLAAAAGPLLLAIGGIVSALPLLISGFAVVTGPVGLAIAAIAAGAVLLITNWQAVTDYFKSSGLTAVFTELGNSLQNTLSSMVGYLKAFVPIAKGLWDSFLSVFTANIGAALKFAGTVLISGLDILSRVLQTFGSIFRGDWQGVWDGVRNIIAAVWNAITNIITSAASGILKVMGGFAGALKLDSLKDSFNSGAASVEKFGKSIQAAYFGAQQLATTNKTVADSFKAVGDEAIKTFSRVAVAGKDKGKKTKLDTDKDLAAIVAEDLARKYDKRDKFTIADQLGIKKGESLDADSLLPGMKAFADGVKPLEAALLKSKSIWQSFKDDIIANTPTLEDVIKGGLTGAFEALGQGISNAFSSGSNLFDSVLESMRGFAKQYGQFLIKYGAGLLITNPVLGGLAIAAGIGLSAFGGGGGGGAKKGGATGSRPSFNAPTSQANTAFGGPGANGGTSVEFKIKGTELIGVLRNQGYKDGR